MIGSGNITLTFDPVWTYLWREDIGYIQTIKVDGYFTTNIHNIAIVDLKTDKNITGQGYTFKVNATVQNMGKYTEIFDITVYINATLSKTLTITLTSESLTTITIICNTTSWIKGNYTITAHITPIPYEINLTDNTYVNGWVLISVVGDVDASRRVDMLDLWLIQGKFGAVIGNPYPDVPEYIPNYDVDCSGRIDMIDLWITQNNFGQTW